MSGGNAGSVEVNTVREVANPLGFIHLVRRNQAPRWFHIDMTTTATVGNRNFKFNFHDEDGNILYDIRAGANQGASTNRHYNFLHGVARETGFQGGSTEMILPLPDFLLVPGMYMTVEDENSIDATDSYTLTYQADF